jgi:hypothetical protein
VPAASVKASVYYCEPQERRGLNLVGLLETADDLDLKTRSRRPLI